MSAVHRFRGAGLSLTLVVSLLVVQLEAGCSLFLVEPPPPVPKRTGYFFCHESMRLPVLDGLIAALAFGNSVYALSKDDTDYRGKTLSQKSEIALSVAIGTLFTTSAAISRDWILECRAAHEAQTPPPVLPLGIAPRPTVPPAPKPPGADETIVVPSDD